jgi:hypothetical protein
MKQVFAAFAVAPLAGALLVTIIVFLFAALVGSASVMGSIVGIAFIVTAGHGYAAAIVLGIPGFLLFRCFGWIRQAHLVLLCASIGSATGAIWPAAFGVIGGEASRAWMALGVFLVAGALVGAVSGLLFARTIKVEPPSANEIAATFD